MKQVIITLFTLFVTLSVFSQSNSLEEGNKCFNDGNYECAINNYNEALKLVTGREKQILEINLSRAKSCLDWVSTANYEFEQRNFKIARENYQNVLQENPNDSFALSQLERCNDALIYLRVQKSTLEFPEFGGNETLAIFTDAPSFQVTANPSWCSIKTDLTSITITCTQNPETYPRNSYMTITAGGKIERINITQKGKKPETSLSVSRQDFLFDGDKINRVIIDIKTNAEDYSIVELPAWCSIGKKEKTWFSLTCYENKSQEPRSGSFKVIAENKEAQIRIQQKGRITSTTSSTTSSSPAQSKTKPKQSKTKKPNCFNCPVNSEVWGLTIGYSNLTYDPIDKINLAPGSDLEGLNLGVRINPLFKYGFGLQTGVFLDLYSNDLSESLFSSFSFDFYSIQIPLQLEYRLNFSKWFNIFAYGGPSISFFKNISNKEISYPVVVEYGIGMRINRLQFNLGRSSHSFNSISAQGFSDSLQNLGNSEFNYQNLILNMTFMF